jgi:hypothetical protein
MRKAWREQVSGDLISMKPISLRLNTLVLTRTSTHTQIPDGKQNDARQRRGQGIYELKELCENFS